MFSDNEQNKFEEAQKIIKTLYYPDLKNMLHFPVVVFLEKICTSFVSNPKIRVRTNIFVFGLYEKKIH